MWQRGLHQLQQRLQAATALAPGRPELPPLLPPLLRRSWISWRIRSCSGLGLNFFQLVRCMSEAEEQPEEERQKGSGGARFPFHSIPKTKAQAAQRWHRERDGLVENTHSCACALQASCQKHASNSRRASPKLYDHDLLIGFLCVLAWWYLHVSRHVCENTK